MQESSYLETLYGKIAYIDIGPKTNNVILFSTGGGLGFNVISSFKWLTNQGFRIISINRPGYFNLSVNSAKSIEEHADIYYEIIKHLKIKEVHVFGVSMGGISALYYAKKYPTNSLLLWSALTGKYVLNKESANSFLGRLIMSRYCINLVSWALLKSVKFFPKATMKSFLKAESYLNKKEISKIVNYEINNSENKKEFIAFVKAMTPMNLMYKGMMDEVDKAKKLKNVCWKSIKCPVLAVYSTVDKDVSKDHMQRLESMISNFRPMYVKSGGHFVWWGEEGKSVIDKSIEFLNG